MKTLTEDEFIARLRTLTHAVPITISALTPVDLPKSVKPGVEVFKLARVNGLTCVSQERAMQRLVPTHQSGARQWGEREGPALVTKGDKVYLTLKVEKIISVVYLARHGSLLKTIPESEVLPYLRPDNRPITIRDYSISRIKRAALNGEQFKIVGSIPQSE